MYIVNNKPVIKDLRVIIPAGWSSRESKAMETVKSPVLARSPGRGRTERIVLSMWRLMAMRSPIE